MHNRKKHQEAFYKNMDDLTAAFERERLFKQWRVPAPKGYAQLDRFSSAAINTEGLTCQRASPKPPPLLWPSAKRWESLLLRVIGQNYCI